MIGKSINCMRFEEALAAFVVMVKHFNLLSTINASDIYTVPLKATKTAAEKPTSTVNTSIR